MTPINYDIINQYVDYLQQIPIEVLAERLAAHGICLTDIQAAWPVEQVVIYGMPTWWYTFVPVGVIAMFIFSLITFINVIFSQNRFAWFRKQKEEYQNGLKTESAEAQKEEGRPPDA